MSAPQTSAAGLGTGEGPKPAAAHYYQDEHVTLYHDDWRDHAACAGAGVDIFFPTQNTGGNRYAEALVYCRACPVTTECLNYALQLENGYRQVTAGMYGGRTPNQRMDLAAAQRRKQAG